MSHQTISTQAQVVSCCDVVAPSHCKKVAWIVFYSAIAVGGVYVIAFSPITISAPLLTLLRGLMLTASVARALPPCWAGTSGNTWC